MAYTDVVTEGIKRCTEWFSDIWMKCMDTIKSPVINHFLCVPMKFDFLCNIMRGKWLHQNDVSLMLRAVGSITNYVLHFLFFI